MNVEKTPIAGLLVVHLDVHEDERGWFKENWQREKMVGAGVPDFGPVQNNISFNAEKGVTRGLHAEPWDKFVSVATGEVFGAWVDLREGSPTYHQQFTVTVTPGAAVFVPRGVANGFQATVDNTAYTYLVNDHWKPDAQYYFVNLKEVTTWPIPLDRAIISEKDVHHPVLAEATPVPAKRPLIIGGTGQLGKALITLLPDALVTVRGALDLTQPPEAPDVMALPQAGRVHHLDIANEQEICNLPWDQVSVVINAAGYTNVDKAEGSGRKVAWQVNAVAPGVIAREAAKHRVPMVHISTDYVFDGRTSAPAPTGTNAAPAPTGGYRETDAVCPLGVYGQSKAAGEIAVAAANPRHWIVRTSWVVGEGNNFVRTMARLARENAAAAGAAAPGTQQPAEPNPVRVVNDQVGRLTFAEDLAAGILHLAGIMPASSAVAGSAAPATGSAAPATGSAAPATGPAGSAAPYGLYNLTNAGTPASWADIAKLVFELTGHDPAQVIPVTTEEYASQAAQKAAPRPRNSVLDLQKLESTGFVVPDWRGRLIETLTAS